MSYLWEDAALEVKQARMEQLGKQIYLDPSSLSDIKAAREELQALTQSISADLQTLGINAVASSPEAIAIRAVPVDLPIERRMELVKLVKEFTDEMMPSSAGRVWGAAVSVLGAAMASWVSLLLLATPAGPGALTTRYTATTFTRLAPKTLIKAAQKDGYVGTMARKIIERVPVIANMLGTTMKPTQAQIAFWCTIGAVEDLGETGTHLLDVWRRRVEPPSTFLRHQQEYAQALATFVNKIEADDVFEQGDGTFKEYIMAETQYPYTLTIDELVYDFYWLECADNWLYAQEKQHNGSFVSLRKSIASLIRLLLVNGVDSIFLDSTYPLFGWWSGIPAKVKDALNHLALVSESTREAFHDLGFTDSETFQSVATMFAQNCTKTGLTVIENTFAKRGIMGLIGRMASSSMVKKMTPAVLRLEDIRR